MAQATVTVWLLAALSVTTKVAVAVAAPPATGIANSIGVRPAIPSDFNGDGIVNFDDFFAFAQAFGTAQGQPGFDPKFDLDGNGKVDLDDFFLFAAAFGQKAG